MMLQEHKLVYLDYAANYPVKKEVLNEFINVETNYIGNYNSTHALGRQAKAKFEEYNNGIKRLLKLDNSYDIIYTSSATEANNLAIKGIVESYKGFGKKILVSEFEHNSVNATLGYLKTSGYDIEFYDCQDLDDLKKKMSKEVILVISVLIDSETGLMFDVEAIREILKDYPNAHHLVDATQAIGKFDFALNKYEMVSFTPHKFGGIIGSGVLVKAKDTILTPIIHGGLSQSIYRSGSVPLGIIATVYKALELAVNNREDNYYKVKKIHDYLLNKLKEIKNVKINSFDNPYIVNISISGIKAKDIVSYFDDNDICVSQKSACSIKNTPSKSVMKLFNDRKRALESFRISLSELVTLTEIDHFITKMKEYINGKI